MHKYGKYMISSLTFMQLFVDDLLNLKLMHDGIFTLNESPFDPNEVFDNVCETFLPLLDAKKIKLTFCVDKALGAPSRNNYGFSH